KVEAWRRPKYKKTIRDRESEGRVRYVISFKYAHAVGNSQATAAGGRLLRDQRKTRLGRVCQQPDQAVLGAS
ncbi:hypothetical protein HaLaN_19905, partial [Haematococcus lacustris]